MRLIWRLTFDKRVPFFLRMLVPLAVVYVISPIDLAPDKVGIIGRMDDLIVMGLATLLLTKLAPRHVIDELTGSTSKRDRPEDKDPSKVVDVSAHIVDDE